MRLDQRCVLQFNLTKSKAQDLIQAGRVFVNDQCILKKAALVEDTDRISIQEQLDFVSRAGFKLYHALKSLNLELTDKICLDIGASTGGFSDCCIHCGAKHVYAFDVGHNQCHPSLYGNDRLTYIDGLNAKNLGKDTFDIAFDFICCDISFISLSRIYDNISATASAQTDIVLLFKPQFECGSSALNKHGVVKNRKLIEAALEKSIIDAKRAGLIHIQTLLSSVIGRSGNQEYIIYYKKGV